MKTTSLTSRFTTRQDQAVLLASLRQNEKQRRKVIQKLRKIFGAFGHPNIYTPCKKDKMAHHTRKSSNWLADITNEEFYSSEIFVNEFFRYTQPETEPDALPPSRKLQEAP